MYQLTVDPDVILRTEDGMRIPRGHRWWDEYEAWVAAGNTPEPLPPLTAEQRNNFIWQGLSEWVRTVPQQNLYDSEVTCLSYLDDPNPVFAAEARAILNWRSAMWSAAIALLADPPPGVETLEQVKALMPQPEQFGWVHRAMPGLGPTDDEVSEELP